MTADNSKRALWTFKDWSTWPERQRARTMNSLSGFKSATLVGTVNDQGQHNLSIVSSVVHLGSSPALLGMVLRPPGDNAHTYKNIMSNKECTFNHINSGIFKQAHQTSARYPADISEFNAVGLTPWLPSLPNWSAPAVLEAQIRMGLRLTEDIALPNGCRFMVCALEWAEVPVATKAPDGYLSIEHAGSLTVSGLDGYHQTQALGRLSYAKVDETTTIQKDILQGWND